MEAAFRGRVLLAQDGPASAREVRDALLQLGYDIAEVADGISAVRRVRAIEPDAAIVDLQGGQDSLRLAGALAAERLAPVIIASESLEPAVVHEAIRAGVEACLVRPVSERQLLPAIELARARFQAAAALRSAVEALRDEAETERLVLRATSLVVAEYNVDGHEALERI
ncbi:MAG TPA: response regulator, partial [Chloroflexota bacterium]